MEKNLTSEVTKVLVIVCVGSIAKVVALRFMGKYAERRLTEIRLHKVNPHL